MRCKFYSTCEHFNPKALTCENGGGKYCGKYRVLSAESTVPVSFFCNPVMRLRKMLTTLE